MRLIVRRDTSASYEEFLRGFPNEEAALKLLFLALPKVESRRDGIPR